MSVQMRKASEIVIAGPDRDDALSPVGRETLQDRVYAQLRNSLINGMFDAGDVLRIVDLAERLQTSTMPVREALGRLVSEQALESLPNRSVRVPLITRDRLNDLARARILIEGQMVALALPNLTNDDFAILKQINVDCDKAFDQHGKDIGHVTSALNQRFHFPHLSSCALAGADPDRREPLAAIGRHNSQGGAYP